ncbi:hypothetical protein Tco_0683502 [Tanacetum coccineum]|uniref:Uncharacterized protein n=1 Tax=Tanacetum coccineum TaxID=301880 RepID=A0ABQ4XVX3_9ASTR
MIFVNKGLVRLIDVTLEQWLDLKYGDHTMVRNDVKGSVIATWLIRSYKKQFDEYMEIKKQKKVYELDAGMEYNPSNVDFDEWLASKFSNYMMMDWYTKNALWIYWTIGDDEDIDVDVLTNDITGFKTYDEYKDAWIYEWNKDVPWVANMPWLDYGPYMEASDDIENVCKSHRFKSVIQNGDVIYFESYEWYENLEEGELKDEALNSKAIVEGWKGVDEESSDNARTHCSPNDKWEDFERARHIGAYANSNYNPYLDVSRIFNDHGGTVNYETQKEEGWFDKQELMGDDDDDIGDLEDYLIQKDPHYYVNDEEEISKERRCNLLGIPYVKPPTCKLENFEVVKYSFRPAEEYVAIKEYKYDIWVRTK